MISTMIWSMNLQKKHLESIDKICPKDLYYHCLRHDRRDVYKRQLWKTVEAVMNTTHDLHVIRDATRGGVGTVLYEIAGQSNVGIRLDAASVPVAPEVKGVCGMLGLEPLYLACEGRMVIMAPKAEAEKIVETLRKCPYSKDAAIIGEVIDDQPGKVVMTTEIGTQALLPQPGGELLPRRCV